FSGEDNQPNVKKLFQPNSTKSTTYRFQNEGIFPAKIWVWTLILFSSNKFPTKK
ncbi:hypothetical protein S83_016100, partial [Arachis hypogaea]